jgi:hypothetical protein
MAATSDVALITHSHSRSVLISSLQFGIPSVVILSDLFVDTWIKLTLLEHTFNELPVPKSFRPFKAVESSDIHRQWPFRHVTDPTPVDVI